MMMMKLHLQSQRQGLPSSSFIMFSSMLWLLLLISNNMISSVLAQTMTATSGEIIGFYLYNADSNEKLVDEELVGSSPFLLENDIIDLAVVGTLLNIKAKRNPGLDNPEYVVFDLDGQVGYSRDEHLPFMLNPDDVERFDFFPVPELAIPGIHTVAATPFAQDGTAGSKVQVTFEIIDSSSNNTNLEVGQTGELRKWHKITLNFTGPMTSETATPNPFTDYRLDVTFTHDDVSGGGGKTYVVPGFYAADGNAANTHATGGNVWLVHFAPDLTGRWDWEASFLFGPNVAQFGDGQPVTEYIHGEKGYFIVEDTDKMGRDHRGKGRLNYVGEHHLQFAETGEWFLKGGVDSPENLFAYNDFDDTPNYKKRRKSWELHIQDHMDGDPTWSDGKGKGIIGAINYLSNMGLNAFSFLTMNIDGDDRNVFPYISLEAENRTRIDVSKTAQWEIVMEQADKLGLFMHFKLQETENDQLLDGGALGVERTLYFRELIARFGHHLALNWNMGEENTNTHEERMAFAEYFRNTDPYQHPVVVHTVPDGKDEVYGPLLQEENSFYVGASLQIGDPYTVFDQTLFWVKESAVNNQKWIVTNDEQGPWELGVESDANDPNHDSIRSGVLWGNIMAGGGGVEYYFGFQGKDSDLSSEDFRARSIMFDQTRHALQFFANVPFQDMSNENDRIVSSNQAWCLVQSNGGETIVVYLFDGADGETTIDLQDQLPATYSIQWFNPRAGGSLQDGPVSAVVSGTNEAQRLGAPPVNDGKDWVVLLRKQEARREKARLRKSVSSE